MENSETKKVTTKSEIGSDGVGHSDAKGELGGATKASPEELELALVASNETIQKMHSELEAMRAENASLRAKGSAPATSEDGINKLATMLANAIAPKAAPIVPPEADNINRSNGYNERQNIDGNSLMEAQSKMLAFKSEKKVAVTVAKTFQNQFGPFLAVTVNGVRVAVPCDGKTYHINETHALHVRERLAKVDRLLADQTPDIREVNA